MQITFSERELEDFLCTGKNLEKYLGLKFIARQVNIAPAGIIDILAYHENSDIWVIIELKKDLLDLSALVQGLSYLRFYQSTKKYITDYKSFQRSRKFCLLLIGNHLDTPLHKVVKNFSDNEFSDNEIMYSLFNINFEEGISFKFYNKSQSDYESRIYEIEEANSYRRDRMLNQ